MFCSFDDHFLIHGLKFGVHLTMRAGRRPRVSVHVINPKPMCSSTVLRLKNGNGRRRLSRAFKLGIAAYTSCRVNQSTACNRPGGFLGGLFKCRCRGQICFGARNRHTTSNFSKIYPPSQKPNTCRGGLPVKTFKNLLSKNIFTL